MLEIYPNHGVQVKPPRKLKYEAYCSGCARGHDACRLTKKKNVPRSAVNCPDCGYALLWKQKEVGRKAS